MNASTFVIVPHLGIDQKSVKSILRELHEIPCSEFARPIDYAVVPAGDSQDSIAILDEISTGLKRVQADSPDDIFFAGVWPDSWMNVGYLSHLVASRSKVGCVLIGGSIGAQQELGHPTRETIISYLVEKHIVPASRLMVLGARSYDQREVAYCKRNRISTFSAEEMYRVGLSEVADSMFGVLRRFDNITIHIDLSVLDPSQLFDDAGAPGGLTTRDLLYVVHRLLRFKSVIGCTVTGFNEQLISHKIAAKLLAEMLGKDGLSVNETWE